MFGLPEGRLCDFVVRCKRCGANIPAPVQTLPDTWIVASCALCGEKRKYVPAEIFRGRLAAGLDAPRGRAR
jgi:hypothetical protein